MEQSDLKRQVEELSAQGKTPEEVYLALLGVGATVAQLEAAYAGIRAADRSTGNRARMVRILSGTGALLVGAGVFSFVAANWPGMPDWSRLAVILAAMTVFSVAGWVVRDVLGYRFTGEALLALGSLVFGAGIFLVAQIFNVRVAWPDGFLLWMLGSLAMAFAVRSTPLHVIAVVAGLIAAIGYPVQVFGGGGVADPFSLSSPLIVSSAAIAALGGAYALRKSLPPAIRERW